MPSDLTDQDGWPCDFKGSTMSQALTAAIRALPAHKKFTAVQIDGFAQIIYNASVSGRNAEKRRNRPASYDASLRELEELARDGDALVKRIEKLREPSIRALFKEHSDPFSVQRSLQELSANALDASNRLIAPVQAKGRPRSVEANEVADEAGRVYQIVTGKLPSVTVTTSNSQVTGVWPDFLDSIFRGLFIDASVSAQARRVMQKTASQTTV